MRTARGFSDVELDHFSECLQFCWHRMQGSRTVKDQFRKRQRMIFLSGLVPAILPLLSLVAFSAAISWTSISETTGMSVPTTRNYLEAALFLGLTVSAAALVNFHWSSRRATASSGLDTGLPYIMTMASMIFLVFFYGISVSSNGTFAWPWYALNLALIAVSVFMSYILDMRSALIIGEGTWPST